MYKRQVCVCVCVRAHARARTRLWMLFKHKDLLSSVILNISTSKLSDTKCVYKFHYYRDYFIMRESLYIGQNGYLKNIQWHISLKIYQHLYIFKIFITGVQ